MLPRLRRLSAVAVPIVLGASIVSAQQVDSLERVIRREMARREIPGLSIAVIDSGRIVLARGYGVTQRGGPPVTDSTLFQAGSISKAVTAAAAMRLVARGTLALDRDINQQLVSWHLRDTSIADGEKVTVRHLLSHTGGLNVHGFPGYALSERMPTAVQVLNHGPGTNTAAVRIEQKPGTQWRYSGGGYTILQVLMSDVTSLPFADLMQQEVLTPAGMTSSTFMQPLPASFAPRAATGHTRDGRPVAGGWHAYPEMAAAGLWTTASDLARFALSLQGALRRDTNALLPPRVAEQMVAYERNDFMGLGLALKGNGGKLEFSHNGRDEGFDASWSATARTGQGVVIMINANDNSGAVERIRTVVANLWRWPNERPGPAAPRAVPVTTTLLTALAGRYEVRNNQMLAFEARDERLLSMADGRPDEEFVPVGEDLFTKADGSVTFAFMRDATRAVTGFEVRDIGGGRRMVPRVGPLCTAFPVRPDADPARTRRTEGLLAALASGRTAERASELAPGALRDFTGQSIGELKDATGLRHLGTEEISARGIERHGGKVARVAYFSASVRGSPRCILIHHTGEGLITDYDIVVR